MHAHLGLVPNGRHIEVQALYLRALNGASSSGQVETEETEMESWNGILKRKSETEKLKIGGGRQKYKWHMMALS